MISVLIFYGTLQKLIFANKIRAYPSNPCHTPHRKVQRDNLKTSQIFMKNAG